MFSLKYFLIKIDGNEQQDVLGIYDDFPLNELREALQRSDCASVKVEERYVLD